MTECSFVVMQLVKTIILFLVDANTVRNDYKLNLECESILGNTKVWSLPDVAAPLWGINKQQNESLKQPCR